MAAATTRRRPARVAICALAGLAATLATAWFPATLAPDVPKARGSQHYLGSRSIADPGLEGGQGRTAWAWFVTRHASLPHTTYVFRIARTRVDADGRPQPSEVFESEPIPLPRWARVPEHGMRVDRHAFGWPFTAMHATFTSPGAGHDFLEVRAARVTGAGAYRRPVRIPIIPVWPGLLADVAFWSALWLAVHLAATAVRKHRRLRRGLCPACAYEVGIARPRRCPECGTRWPRRRPVVP